DEYWIRSPRHLVLLRDIPRGDQDTAGVWVIFQLVHDRFNLVYVLAIRSRPGAPLHAVDRAQFGVVISPFIPDADLIFLQPRHVGLAAQKPQQLADNTVEVHLLGGQQRK